MGELSALGAAFLWSVTSVGIRFGSKWIDILWLNTLRCLGGAVVGALLAGLVAGGPGILFTIPPAAVGWLLVSTLFGNAVGDSVYFRACQIIGITRALPIANASPLLTLAAGAAFLDEPLTPRLVLGALLILGGVYLVARPSGKTVQEVKPLPPTAFRHGLLLSGLAAVCWASSSALLKVALSVGEIDVLAANSVRLGFAGIVVLAIIRQSKRPHPWQMLGWRFVVVPPLMGLAGVTSPVLFILAVQLAGVGKTTVLSATAPLFALPLSLLFLGERLTRRIVAGTVLSVAGIWLVL
ncbi:MAG: DMT family transporter [Chloroflexi bacterium]|nr:DMT family transporter [Chloroflexota bacterium]